MQAVASPITRASIIAAGGDFIPFLPLEFSIDARDYLDDEEYKEYLLIKNDDLLPIFLRKTEMIDVARSRVAKSRRRSIIDAFDCDPAHDADTTFYAEIARDLEHAKNAHLYYSGEPLERNADDDFEPFDSLDCLFFEDE